MTYNPLGDLLLWAAADQGFGVVPAHGDGAGPYWSFLNPEVAVEPTLIPEWIFNLADPWRLEVAIAVLISTQGLRWPPRPPDSLVRGSG